MKKTYRLSRAKKDRLLAAFARREFIRDAAVSRDLSRFSGQSPRQRSILCPYVASG